MKTELRWVLVLAAFFIVGVASAKKSTSDAVADRFRGEIVVLKKRPPARFGSKQKFSSYLRKNRLKKVLPYPKNRLAWRIEYMAFLKAPANDVELKIKFFDVTAQRQFVVGDSLFTSARDQRILSAHSVLKRPQFRPQRKYQMYITDSRNFVLAKTTFWLKGPTEKFSGKVTFDDDEPQKPEAK